MSYVFTESFPYLLNRVGVRMGELFTRHLQRFDLTLPMYRVMAVLRQNGTKTLGELSAMVTVEISTLSRLIGGMAKRGLVSRSRSNDNGRIVEIDITPKGIELVEKLMPIAAHFEIVATSTLTPEASEGLKHMLREVYRNMDQLEAELNVTVAGDNGSSL